ncbi:sigma-70 family RNA polymerase sigma factor [Sorangium sp. So ce124]|uniref:sigma-70 family RNA polymerase sigma factor n=1 Tax=Sorangium sp. So ce124 TaxID=3133280 RepID=UPI003F5DCBD1
MSDSRPPRVPDPRRDPRVARTLPEVRRIARTVARTYGVRAHDVVEECEQIACQALVEAFSGFDASRGVPLLHFAWKRVVGAVRDWIAREASPSRAGVDAGDDVADALRFDSDPFESDSATRERLSGYCRALSVARFLGDCPELLDAGPHDALVRAEALDALVQALDRVDERERRLIALRYGSDLSWAKVGEELSVHEKFAQRLDERLRERLGRALRQQGICEAPPAEGE